MAIKMPLNPLIMTHKSPFLFCLCAGRVGGGITEAPVGECVNSESLIRTAGLQGNSVISSEAHAKTHFSVQTPTKRAGRGRNKRLTIKCPPDVERKRLMCGNYPAFMLC